MKPNYGAQYNRDMMRVYDITMQPSSYLVKIIFIHAVGIIKNEAKLICKHQIQNYIATCILSKVLLFYVHTSGRRFNIKIGDVSWLSKRQPSTIWQSKLNFYRSHYALQRGTGGFQGILSHKWTEIIMLISFTTPRLCELCLLICDIYYTQIPVRILCGMVFDVCLYDNI